MIIYGLHISYNYIYIFINIYMCLYMFIHLNIFTHDKFFTGYWKINRFFSTVVTWKL